LMMHWPMGSFPQALLKRYGISANRRAKPIL
jgi:hypothetical protein